MNLFSNHELLVVIFLVVSRFIIAQQFVARLTLVLTAVDENLFGSCRVLSHVFSVTSQLNILILFLSH